MKLFDGKPLWKSFQETFYETFYGIFMENKVSWKVGSEKLYTYLNKEHDVYFVERMSGDCTSAEAPS